MLLNPSSPLQALHNIGTNIDTDFLLLVPSHDDDGYILGGFITCFPSGFDTQALLGKKIRDIHKPVPKYKEKLETSMYRNFDRLEVGKMIKRFNTYLRCERQLLHRLPETKTLVFSVRTYLTPLSQLKEEGFGEELAEAIDGLKKGSVPEIHYYKRGVVWGETVKEYLRS
ncbi:hypothetical protein EYC80_005892 [Monilinia laxa]|uniref:Uncharacterized protein n=1 Tax=Monilinia laxa TaxID=61186 RepID=A0A5N6KFD3_MONLA|nr:hypothetical protein EYC80_005892 [Monilinia laxa]